MAAIPFPHTRLNPPRIKKFVRREGLLELGRSILSHRVTTVIAPAGYGKSVWVSSLLDEKEWPPTCWLSLDRHDNEPAYFLNHLIHALQRVYPDFGSQSLCAVKKLEDAGSDWLIAVSSIIDEIPKGIQIVLIMDDFHLIQENADVTGIVDYLIRWMPAGMHMVLIGRNSAPLALHRVKISGELLEIGYDHLSFSVEETQELLKNEGLEFSPENLSDIHTHSGGWAAGLRLIVMFLKKNSGSIEEMLPVLNMQDSGLYTYLGSELLGALPLQLHHFLQDASLLPYLEVELCNAALQRSDSGVILKQLYAFGMLSQVEGETVTWRMRPMIEEYLQQKTSRDRMPGYIAALRRRAVAFMEKKGDIEGAMEQAVAGVNGRAGILCSWIAGLPEDIVAADHRLLFLKGTGNAQTDPDAALSALSAAAGLAEKNGDQKGLIHSLIGLIYLNSLTNNLEKIKEISDRIPLDNSVCKDSWSRGILLVIALGRAAWEDRLEQGLKLIWQAGKAKLEPLWRMAYLFFSCVIQFRLGNLSAARKLIEEVLQLAYVRENEHWTSMAGKMYTAVLVYAGDHAKLSEVCHELLRRGKKYEAPHQMAYAHRHLGCAYHREGGLVAARREYELARACFAQSDNVYPTLLTEFEILLLRCGSGENAKGLLVEAQNLLNTVLADPGGPGFADYALCLAGVIAREAGELELARQYLEDSAALSVRKRAKQSLASTQLHLARLYLVKGQETKADNFLRKAFDIAEAQEYECFIAWHADTVYLMCSRALFKGIHQQWAARLLRRWFSRRACQDAGHLLSIPNEKTRTSAASLIKDIVRETGTPVVHVNSLGWFHVFVNGVEILPTRWKTQKALNLFKFLIADRRRHPKERIIEQLWPESDPQAGDASLRMALSHVRKALAIDKNSCDSVVLKRGMIYLSPEIELYTDHELFAASAQQALQKAIADDPVSTRTLQRVAGLYPGRFLTENLYDDWTASLRENLHSLYLRVLQNLVQSYRQQEKRSSLLQICYHYLFYEPTDEQVGRLAMEALWKTGQKQRALSLYKDITKALAVEYDIPPEPETVALYEKIRCS